MIILLEKAVFLKKLFFIAAGGGENGKVAAVGEDVLAYTAKMIL